MALINNEIIAYHNGYLNGGNDDDDGARFSRAIRARFINGKWWVTEDKSTENPNSYYVRGLNYYYNANNWVIYVNGQPQGFQPSQDDYYLFEQVDTPNDGLDQPTQFQPEAGYVQKLDADGKPYQEVFVREYLVENEVIGLTGANDYSLITKFINNQWWLAILKEYPNFDKFYIVGSNFFTDSVVTDDGSGLTSLQLAKLNPSSTGNNGLDEPSTFVTPEGFVRKLDELGKPFYELEPVVVPAPSPVVAPTPTESPVAPSPVVAPAPTESPVAPSPTVVPSPVVAPTPTTSPVAPSPVVAPTPTVSPIAPKGLFANTTNTEKGVFVGLIALLASAIVYAVLKRKPQRGKK
jgi:hypothetical protein